jgi:hypothetical protein
MSEKSWEHQKVEWMPEIVLQAIPEPWVVELFKTANKNPVEDPKRNSDAQAPADGDEPKTE